MKPNLSALLAKSGLKPGSDPLRRALVVEPKVLDEKAGTIRYVASDETMDHSCEIVRVNGWQFDFFEKNSPFVDSHDYSECGKLLGKVVNYAIEGDELIEDVQYALTEKGDTLADWAFKMARDKFLKAVSVGFVPTKMATKWDRDPSAFAGQCSELGLSAADAAMCRAIYIQQQQLELSQCILGMNPNALAKAYKAGTLSEQNIESFAALFESTKHVAPAEFSADADAASPRTKLALMAAIQAHL